MGILFSILYLAVFLAAGFVLARRVLPASGPEAQLVYTAAFGLVLLIALPALFALALGFTLPAALLALATAAGISLAGFLSRRSASGRVFRKQSAQTSNVSHSPSLIPAFWGCVLPLLLFSIWLLHTHTLYYKEGAYWCGQSTYGDLPMHLSFIKSIAEQGLFPPEFPMLAGQTLYGYPFLCESVSSVFLLLGAPLKFACILPQVVALAAVFGGGWLLARHLLHSNTKASLAFVLFFLGSGFGFAYFLEGGFENFARIFTAYYETPTNYVEENIRWVNPIADLLIPQRATLFGWALLFPCLALLVRFALEEEYRLWPALVLLAASLPLVQTHSALALVLICGVLFTRSLVMYRTNWKALRPWLLFAAVTAVIWLPLMLTQILPHTQEGSGFLRLHFNWSNEGDNYFWFYIKNIGLVYILLLPAFLWAGKKLRWVYGGGLLILLLSEFVEFQPNDYDNNKLLFIWHLLGCILVANLIVDLLKKVEKRSVQTVLCAMLVFTGTFGSILTLGREAVSQYQHFDADAIAVADYVEENTDPMGRFLCGTQLLNPVLSLSGRPILCASGTWLYYHGMDYSAQEAAVRQLLESPSDESLNQWGIDYVMISPSERADYAVNENWFATHCTLLYDQGGYSIYQVNN
ncbi:hypothetical protein [Allofournierella massiliensis]|uniref:hypothetical protein n=1 Tax=Allofournierella massiliensis TaxID=1650663 RepID=UPI0035690D84